MPGTAPCTPPAPPKGIIDGQLNDIDVTQAVQPVMTFTASDAPGGRTRAYGANSTGEVSLQAGRTTVARVYASLKTGPAGGIGNVPATLEGVAGGQSLGTIQPDASPFAEPGQLTIGVIAHARGELAGSTPSSSHFHEAVFGGGVLYVTADRPLTSVSHELNHALGRVHASYCNGGGAGTQRAETWPPDEQGYLQGVGLDTRAGSGGGRGPYKIIAAGAPGDPAQEYDFMSYCAVDSDSWISPRGWTEVINYFGSGANPTASLRTNRAAAAATAPRVPRAIPAASERILSASGVQLASGTLALTGAHPAIGRPSTPETRPLRTGSRLATAQVGSWPAPRSTW